ncbi:DUF2637 domain-containing protein [Micromonospora zamorensis]|uniref:DUF2637 domain-containing protein n=1 Tax=Micromonospora zamorensis TaxID=709883 RepID=A0ABZ1PQY0_9ACTN
MVAGYASFSHIFNVARQAGEHVSVAAVLPLSIDGLILVGTLAMLEDKRSNRKPGLPGRLAVAFGIVATLAANAASARPGIELTADTPYLSKEQRQLVSSIIGSKIPVADLVESWHQVGPRVTATWTVRKRPPARVSVDQVRKHLPRLAEPEFHIGQGAGDRPVALSLRDDSPHSAVSAGKSVLAELIAVQVLARGGHVVILDRKGSHRRALGLAKVDYCTKPTQMHNALVRLAVLADERSTLALHEPEGWD